MAMVGCAFDTYTPPPTKARKKQTSVSSKQKSTENRKLYNINLDFIIENSK